MEKGIFPPFSLSSSFSPSTALFALPRGEKGYVAREGAAPGPSYERKDKGQKERGREKARNRRKGEVGGRGGVRRIGKEEKSNRKDSGKP